MRLLLLSVATFCFLAHPVRAREVWTPAQAQAWGQQQGWLVGANFTPASAINQLEMWQAETFDAPGIERELGWAEAMGMNTLRVFLHDLLWEQDAKGFQQRLDQFLTICQKHKIKPMLVLFDSCWDPAPKLGKQREPKPGVHNSGWVQSPAVAVLQDNAQWPRLKAYAQGTPGVPTVCRFFSAAFAPKSSHFYTNMPYECDLAKTYPAWTFEGEVFNIPGAAADGTCAPGTVPVYRLYNNGQSGAPNHRYVTVPLVRDQMLAAGWVLEGNLPGLAFMCAPQ